LFAGEYKKACIALGQINFCSAKLYILSKRKRRCEKRDILETTMAAI